MTKFTTTKVEVIGDSLTGPYTIKLNDTVITDVEDIQLVNDGKVNRVLITLLTNNYTLKPAEPKVYGGIVKEHTLAYVGGCLCKC